MDVVLKLRGDHRPAIPEDDRITPPVRLYGNWVITKRPNIQLKIRESSGVASQRRGKVILVKHSLSVGRHCVVGGNSQ